MILEINVRREQNLINALIQNSSLKQTAIVNIAGEDY